MAEKLPEKRPETGWGEFLQAAFDSSKVKVVKLAKNGRSTRTFITEGLWQQIIEDGPAIMSSSNSATTTNRRKKVSATLLRRTTARI